MVEVYGNYLSIQAGQAQGQFGQVGPSMLSAGATGLGTGLISYGSRGQGLQDDLDKKKGK